MSEKQFTEECLAVMNKYRAIHQAAPLSYDRGLEQVAKQWATHLTKTNTWAHNPNANYKGKVLGENIASHWTSNNEGYKGAHAVAQWYDEIERYNFKTHQGPKTGHFTQLVWRDSRNVGVGLSQSKDGTWIAVANYYPPGNVIGEYPQNVLPPRDGKKSVIPHDAGHHKRVVSPISTPQRVVSPISTPQRVVSPTPSSRPTPQPNDGHPTATKTVATFRKAVRTEVHGDVTTITTTETTKGHDGMTTVKVTEKVSRPGKETKVKVTLTETMPDGKKTTTTLETTEK